jgi:hypothetical protein
MKLNCAEAENPTPKKLSLFAQVSGAGVGGFRSGWRALTTMLIFGRNSASYCTHNAATAASCICHRQHNHIVSYY